MDAALEDRIVNAVEVVRAQGIDVYEGEWGVQRAIDGGIEPIKGGPCCCPLGALLLAEHAPFVARNERETHLTWTPWSQDPEASAAFHLGCSIDWVRAFLNGVDGHGLTRPAEEDAWIMGRRVRDRAQVQRPTPEQA